MGGLSGPATDPGSPFLKFLLARLEQFVKTCLVCQQDKVERQKTAGLLEPLPIPEKPWVSLSMD